MLYQGTPKNKKLLQPQTDNCTTDLNRSIKMSPAPKYHGSALSYRSEKYGLIVITPHPIPCNVHQNII